MMLMVGSISNAAASPVFAGKCCVLGTVPIGDVVYGDWTGDGRKDCASTQSTWYLTYRKRSLGWRVVDKGYSDFGVAC